MSTFSFVCLPLEIFLHEQRITRRDYARRLLATRLERDGREHR